MNNDKVENGSLIHKDYVRKTPKTHDQIHTIDDIADDLHYITNGFPEAAIHSALNKQSEITTVLLHFLDKAIHHYESIEDYYFGHLHALYLLAKFREKKAFDRAIKIMSLPNEWPENLLGDTITEDLHKIVASLYNDDIASIHAVIENPKLNTWSRNAALKTLLVLVKEKILVREEIILYFQILFDHPSFKDDMDAMTNLVNACCDLYPLELQDKIQCAFDRGIVDDFVVNMKWVKSVLSDSQEAALENFLNDRHYSLINDDDIKSMKHWACFSEKPEKNVSSDFEYHKPQIASYTHTQVFPYRRNYPKIGRNDPCPCGSGEKYKKCCLSVTSSDYYSE